MARYFCRKLRFIDSPDFDQFIVCSDFDQSVVIVVVCFDLFRNLPRFIFSYQLFFSERLRLPILSLIIYIFLFALSLITFSWRIISIFYFWQSYFSYFLYLNYCWNKKAVVLQVTKLSFLFNHVYDLSMNHGFGSSFGRKYHCPVRQS